MSRLAQSDDPRAGFGANHFDLIRLIAATQVVLMHSLYHFQVDWRGPVMVALELFPGVPVFFFISGLLISAAYERSSSWRSYTINRCLRIFPGLWVCLVLSTLVAWWFVRFDVASVLFWVWLASQASIVQFFHPAFLSEFGSGVLNGSLWTIPVELQFYACIPLIYVLLTRWRDSSRWVLPLMIVLAIAVNRYLAFELNGVDSMLAKLIGVTFLPHIYLFLLGILANRHFARWLGLVRGREWWILVVYVGVAMLLESIGVEVRGNAINPLSAILLCMLVFSFGYYRVPAVRPLKGMDISYGVYIYHMPLINLLLEIGPQSGDAKLWLLLLLLTACACLSWFLVERPALNFRHRSGAGRSRSIPSEAACP